MRKEFCTAAKPCVECSQARHIMTTTVDVAPKYPRATLDDFWIGYGTPSIRAASRLSIQFTVCAALKYFKLVVPISPFDRKASDHSHCLRDRSP